MQKSLDEAKATEMKATDVKPVNGKEISVAKTKTGAVSVAQSADVSRLSTGELVARIAQDAQDLVKAEIQLARTELRTNLQGVVTMAKGLAIAALLFTGAFFTLVAAAVLGLTLVLEPWAAALVVGGALLVLGGAAALFAASKKVAPLERTRKNVKDDLQWAKERAA